MAKITTQSEYGALSLRRARLSSSRRKLFRDVHLSESQFLQPYFVAPSTTLPQGSVAVPGLPGVFRDDEEAFIARAVADREMGVRGALLFSVPEHKHVARGDEHFNVDFASRMIERLRAACGDDYFIATDVCFCSYTEHGHCGILNEHGDYLKNAETVEELAKASVSFAKAGADCVAPSDMMDGRIGAIRSALDEAGLDRTMLMSYSVKLHSKFYEEHSQKAVLFRFKIIELRTTIPAPAIIPIIEVAVKNVPDNQCAGKIPTSVKGIGIIIISGTLKD